VLKLAALHGGAGILGGLQGDYPIERENFEKAKIQTLMLLQSLCDVRNNRLFLRELNHTNPQQIRGNISPKNLNIRGIKVRGALQRVVGTCVEAEERERRMVEEAQRANRY
jgi:hypothetical protein